MAQVPGSARVLLVAVAALVALVAVTTVVVVRRDPDVVATVDGHPITRDELVFHMRLLRPAVQNELQVALRSGGVELDWDAEHDGRTGVETLRERALAQAVADKELLLVALDLGLVEGVDFATIEAARASENGQRERDLGSGEVVYGLTEFGQAEFYARTLTEVRTQVGEQLSADPEDPLHVTQDEVRAAYESRPEDWSADATTYALTRLVVPVEGDREAARRVLTDQLADRPDLTAVAASWPGATLAAETLTGSAAAMTPPQRETLQLISGLAAHAMTAPVDDGGRLVVLRLDEALVDADRALAEYGSRIGARLLDDKLDGFLSRRTDDSEIVVDRTALATINLEGLDT